MKKYFKHEILKRAMIAFKCTKVNEIASLFNITPQNLNGYLDRGTFINLIRSESFKRNIDLKWIETGNYSSDKTVIDIGIVAEPQKEYSGTPKPHPETAYPDHLVHKTRTVLTSDTVFRRALDSNIEAFHEAVSMKEQLAETKAALDQCIDQIALLKNEIEHLKGDRGKKAV